ncbi:lipocalin family protein [Nitrincola sp. A-D6]|uniref:lipocalin family protein n=1 Tax=Nitrincola sp. A-D6 TaxID=1545442 RepID=UPI000AC5728B
MSPFDLNKYLGEWHEIARLDHRFEKGLTQVTAQYSLRDDGGVSVINRGFNAAEQRWNVAEGKAYFVEGTDVGRLKVSFFGPFYGGYNIAKLDDDYTLALVVGPTTDYAWLLARTKDQSKTDCDLYIQEAEHIGIDRDSWIWLQPCTD